MSVLVVNIKRNIFELLARFSLSNINKKNILRRTI